MNKDAFFLLILLIFCSTFSNGQVWRLNNIPGVDSDFTNTLQDAIDGVSSGDTIYVEPSPYSYGSATLAKKVILIGAGYFLNYNDSTQASKNESMVGELNFINGSEGSVISGLYIYRQFPDNTKNWYLIEIDVDSITLQRNYIYGEMLYCNSGDGDCAGYAISIDGNRKAVIIQQNWIETSLVGATGTSNSCIVAHLGPFENLIFRNNFLWSRNSVTNRSLYETTSNPTTGISIYNNIFSGDVHTLNTLHLNNILISGSFFNETGSVVNNLSNSDQYPVGNNNQLNISMSSVFENYSSYIDNGYILKTGSPAIGAGINGGDCGIFGSGYGGEPYVLSGLPAIPIIFEVNFNHIVFPADSTTIHMNIKAKSNH